MAWTDWQSVETKGVVLWERPLLEYSGGTINVNISEYQNVLITFYTNGLSTPAPLKREHVGIWIDDTTVEQIVQISDAVGGHRQITIKPNSIGIGAYIVNGGVYDNSYLVPDEIIGFKKKLV